MTWRAPKILENWFIFKSKNVNGFNKRPTEQKWKRTIAMLVSLSICQLVHHFGTDWKISTTIRWIATNFKYPLPPQGEWFWWAPDFSSNSYMRLTTTTGWIVIKCIRVPLWMTYNNLVILTFDQVKLVYLSQTPVYNPVLAKLYTWLNTSMLPFSSKHRSVTAVQNHWISSLTESVLYIDRKENKAKLTWDEHETNEQW